MSYIPNTDAERNQMLKKIGVHSFEELIQVIPEKFLLLEPLNLSPPLSELELTQLVNALASKNIDTQKFSSFLGAGVYDHFIPAAVDTIVSRPEFYTAYTPYQAEVSQGTLQYIYEYQTLICELTGMEISNASMYDGATAVAEAILMAVRKNHLKKAIISSAIHPEFIKVIQSYTEGIGLELIFCETKDGKTDISDVIAKMDEDISSVVIQTPNFLGNIESMNELEKVVHSHPKTLLIMSVDPISLGILKPPSSYNADIVTGEGQALGNNMYMGGLLFGFFATHKDMARLMPGRIVGATVDVEGRRAYTLTLQAREQHIRREKATSNICSNESLCVLAATVYLSLLGREGLTEVAIQSTQKAHFLANKIASIPGFSLCYPETSFFKEFAIHCPVPAQKVIQDMLDKHIFAGVDLKAYGYDENTLLIAVTEKKTRAELEAYANALREMKYE